MRITVQVTPRSRRTAIKQIDKRTYKVWVTAAPEHGKATTQVLALVAEYFNVAPSTIMVVAGATGRQKIIEF